MAKRKTPEQIADEQRRYALASGARSVTDFEVLAGDSNQAIRATAAQNPAADARCLELFLSDPFWGVRVELARHPNATTELLLQLLEPDPRKRGVVHNEARQRLIAEGTQFGEDGLPVAPEDEAR